MPIPCIQKFKLRWWKTKNNQSISWGPEEDDTHDLCGKFNGQYVDVVRRESNGTWSIFYNNERLESEIPTRAAAKARITARLTQATLNNPKPHMNCLLTKIRGLIQAVVFQCKWLLVPFYLGLVLALVSYLYRFSLTEFEMLSHANTNSEEEILLFLLKLVDATMTANLVVMIIRGSYRSFVDKKATDGDEKERVSSGTLKIKMGTSLIVISFIHLLQCFLKSDELNWHSLAVKTAIFLMFVGGTIALAYIEHLHDQSEHPAPSAEKH